MPPPLPPRKNVCMYHKIPGKVDKVVVVVETEDDDDYHERMKKDALGSFAQDDLKSYG
jgi:hypothetical protein